MKLKNKVLIVVMMSCFIFLALANFKPFSSSMVNLGLLAIVITLITVVILRYLVINRIEQLNQKLSNLSKDITLGKRIEISGKDELADIAGAVNQMLDEIKESSKNYKNTMHEQLQELQKKNFQLQHEMIERQSAERELTRHKENLTQIMKADPLTSLPNGIFFNEVLNKSINHARRRKKILAVLIVSIDNFNKTVAQLGFSKGDLILKEMAVRFTNTLRTEDVLAKLNSEEFIILLNDITQAKFASTVAEKLLKTCSEPMSIDNHKFSLTASIGICIYPNDGESLEALLKNVDKALFTAKSTNGNCYQFYSEELGLEAKEHVELEIALRKAIHNNELVLYYQPKLQINRATITGVEALIRWEHPTMGLISPMKFLPLAEETGLSMQIGEWAIREACRKNKFWQDEGYEHITVSVNLSPKQFHDPNIVKIITKALNLTNLNPKHLEIEITENIVMDNVELAATILNNIKATGVQISIDHFGTGYTAISYLKQFPINTLKIDQSFVRGIPNNPNDMAIVSAFIALAHNLGLNVVAEGVETADQVHHLANLHCDVIQGYFLGHPLSADKIMLQLKKIIDEVLQ